MVTGPFLTNLGKFFGSWGTFSIYKPIFRGSRGLLVSSGRTGTKFDVESMYYHPDPINFDLGYGGPKVGGLGGGGPSQKPDGWIFQLGTPPPNIEIFYGVGPPQRLNVLRRGGLRS